MNTDVNFPKITEEVDDYADVWIEKMKLTNQHLPVPEHMHRLSGGVSLPVQVKMKMKEEAPKKKKPTITSDMSDEEKQQLYMQAEQDFQQVQDEHIRNVALAMSQARDQEVEQAKAGLKNAIMEIIQNKVDGDDPSKKNPLPKSLMTRMHYDRIISTKEKNNKKRKHKENDHDEDDDNDNVEVKKKKKKEKKKKSCSKKTKNKNPFIDDEAEEVPEGEEEEDEERPMTPSMPDMLPSYSSDQEEEEEEDHDDDGYYQMSSAISPQTSPIRYDDDNAGADPYVPVDDPSAIEGPPCSMDENSTIDTSALEISNAEWDEMAKKFHAKNFQVTLYDGQWYRWGSHRKWCEDWCFSCFNDDDDAYSPRPLNKQIHLTYDKEKFDDLLESMPENGIKGMLEDYHTMEVNMQHAVDMEHNKKLQKNWIKPR